MDTFNKLKDKFTMKVKHHFSKQAGDENLLTACILIFIGIVVCAILIGQVQTANTQVAGALNNRIEATQQANTWIT